MGQEIMIDVAHCFDRLCHLVNWSLETRSDPRERARVVVRSLIGGREAHSAQLKEIVGAELAAERGAQVPPTELREQSIWLDILEASYAELNVSLVKSGKA